MDNNTMHANPFAGTGKVFKFSLKQMLTSKGWLGSTLITAVLLLIGIPLLVLCICKIASKAIPKRIRKLSSWSISQMRRRALRTTTS